MSLTTAEQVRLRIQDVWRYGDETIVGDGLRSDFKLQQGMPYSQIISSTAYVNAGGTAWSATGCTFNTALGTVNFSGTISANTALRVSYLWAVFSDNEIAHFTGIAASVPGASLEATKSLLFDAYKRARWAAPDGSKYDDTMAFNNLMQLKSALTDELNGGEAGALANIESWAINQQDY